MLIIESPQEMQALCAQWKCQGNTIGFVPTMGALHEGHLELCRRARQEHSKFVASIFVNPLQFGPNEDLQKYPRPFERDCDLLRQSGCDALFAPPLDAMYGTGITNGHAAQGVPHTFVEVAVLGEVWEGVTRPGHMRGVATVVAKLFNIVGPTAAYFGEKDYQQLKIIEQMVRDLDFPLEVAPVSTVRESDGLALSSRNAYLNEAERQAAPALYRALCKGRELAQNGERDVTILGCAMQEICDAEPLISVQYITVVDPQTLAPLHTLEGPARVLIAARVGNIRLIDNIEVGRQEADSGRQ
ncbi:MAG TPA: pantoate--beta-alanine ligase [Abditibacteriaceae bacterium]|jgi:pantoate--beta-alanine ligase